MRDGICPVCDIRVHDLEGMAEGDVQRLLDMPGRHCIKVRVGRDGRVRLGAGAAALSLTLATAAACTPLSAALELASPESVACIDENGFEGVCDLPKAPAPSHDPVPAPEDDGEPTEDFEPSVEPADAPTGVISAPPEMARLPTPDAASEDGGVFQDCLGSTSLTTMGGLYDKEPEHCVPVEPGVMPGIEVLAHRLQEAAPPPEPRPMPADAEE